MSLPVENFPEAPWLPSIALWSYLPVIAVGPMICYSFVHK